MIQKNKKRMIPKVKTGVSSNHSHKLIHSFIHSSMCSSAHSTNVHRLLHCSRLQVWGWIETRLSPCTWGSDGIDQWSCLTLGGCHPHDLAFSPGWMESGPNTNSPTELVVLCPGAGKAIWDLPESGDCHPTYTPTPDALQCSSLLKNALGNCRTGHS